ncbi:MAG: hypothetical protein QXZ41_08530 [Ignisphaera sp.]
MIFLDGLLKKLRWVAERARGEGIEYIYIGNVGDPQLESTKCPRYNYSILIKGRYIPWKNMFRRSAYALLEVIDV